jgi:hypothetical protein
MQKAYICEAILLLNREVDDAVRGLERLKRAKDSGLSPVYFEEKLTLFEAHRAALNGYYCNNTENAENRDEARFAKRRREHEERMLDEVQVCQDVQAIEESRRLEGRAPRVCFLSDEEQRAWERQYPKLPSDVASDVERREGEQR